MPMNLTEQVENSFQESIRLKMLSMETLTLSIVQVAEAMANCLQQSGKILTCGNGGSAGDAQHFSSEMLNRFEKDRPGLPAIALTTDTFALTSIANDYQFSEIFAKQIRALGQRGDILLAITTSGNSPNIINAVLAAQEKQMSVVLLSGRDGGTAAQYISAADWELRVAGSSTARIQEVHLLVIHCLCELIEQLLFA